MVDRSRIISELSKISQAELKRLFGAVFSGTEGQKALMYILVKIGGVAALRGNSKQTDAQERLRMDGKAEAALEIMALAGFSPFDLALRVLDLKPLTLMKDLENETDTAANHPKRRRPGRAAVHPTSAPPGAVSERPGYAGDPEPATPAAPATPASVATESATESPDTEYGGD